MAAVSPAGPPPTIAQSNASAESALLTLAGSSLCPGQHGLDLDLSVRGDIQFHDGAGERRGERLLQVVAVGKHLGLVRQVGPAAVDQVDAGRLDRLGSLMCP